MKRQIMTMAGITMAALLGASALTGCGSNAGTQTAPQQQSTAQDTTAASSPSAPVLDSSASVGAILLSVNPEIEVEYDGDGKVTEVEGLNDDGIRLSQNAQSYIGLPVNEAVRSLVAEIDDAGYFDATIAGHEKNIIIKLDPQSKVPSDHFLNDIADEVRAVVSQRQIGSQAMTVDDNDYDDTYRDKGYINSQTAQELLKAQLERDDIQFVEKEYDIDDGTYEIEFILDNKEYEYEVDAYTGKIMEMDVEDDGHSDDWSDDRNDDWDDDDGRSDDWSDDRDDDWDDDDGRSDDWSDDHDDDWDDGDDERSDDWSDDHDDWDDDDDWDDEWE